MKKYKLVLFLSLFGFFAGGPVRAEAPLKINFQGRLVEGGAPVDAQRSFIFRIYDAASGGANIWTSQTHNVAVANGVFSVVLQTGTLVNLSTGTFTGARYVEISVGGATLSPRQEMLSVPYALVAQALSTGARIDPAGLDAGTVPVNVRLLPVSISSGSLAANVIASSIAVNAVSSTSLKNDSVTFEKIASNGCLTGEIMKRNGGNTAWECAIGAGGAGTVSLAPSSPDSDATTDPSIYIDDIGGGELLKLLQNGVDKFTVDNNGLLTAGGLTAPRLQLADNVVISSEADAAKGAGVNISSNVYIVGFSSAAKYYGDGSQLTGIGAATADNLGNHTATLDLDMAGKNIINAASGTFTQGVTASSFTAIGEGVRAARLLLADNVAISSEAGAARGGGVTISSNVYVAGRAVITGAVTAAYYQVNGSTALALLPGAGSMAVGVDAGRANTGNYNLFVGSAAGYANTSGDGNAFAGFAAGYNTETGGANTIFGSEAGYGAPAGSFSSSTLVGYKAGFGLTTGGDNIFAGFKAGYAVTTGTGNIIIGYEEDASAPDASNEINIGGVYKGSISSGTATIPKYTVRIVFDDTTAAFGETITVNSASDVIVTLPPVTAGDVGATITVIKVGTGKVTLAANGTPIADSDANGTIYNNAFSPAYAALTLRLADETHWGILSGDGAWLTTAP